MRWLDRDCRTALRAPHLSLSPFASRIGPEEKQWALEHEMPPQNLVCVTTGSPLNHRRVVEELAYYFKREFHYDFVQYSVQVELSARAFLWVAPLSWSDNLDEKWNAVGACCFRWRVYRDPKYPPGYAMQWIWLHPYYRRQGLLSAAWPYFTRRFGQFNVEGPLSQAMEGFLQQQGYFTTEEETQHERPAG